MSTLDKMDVALHVWNVKEQSEKLGRLYGAYSNFFYGKKDPNKEVDQATLQGIETIASELEKVIANAQVKVEELFALSEKIRES